MSSLFDGYVDATTAAYDEMFAGESLRDVYADVHDTLGSMSREEVRSRADSLASSYVDQGVTFGVGGEERPFPLDIVPRIIEADRWRTVETGVAQRVRALEAFLDDVYGEGALFRDGVMPRSVVTSSPHFHRSTAGLRYPNGVRIHVGGIDLIRDEAGDFRVLEDNVRVPSGVSYVMTNRRALSSALPEVFGHHPVRSVTDYPRRLVSALRAAAPAGVSDPTVVVMTPGVYNSAYFEHALLARMMGVELVEGRDLLCRAGQVLMRTTNGYEPVHVIYRRIDDDFLDPLHFRADSVLGIPGLVNAARAGNVTVANGLGNGVADDKLVYSYVPDLIRYYLSEEPVLRNVDTWRMGEAAHREEVMDRLHELVLKPVDGAGGAGIVIGPRATTKELDQLRTEVLADPRAWIAQPVISLSTSPTLINRDVRPRHVDLRPFAVNSGDDVWVLPGGLTRVALPEGELIVNSSKGGGSKDTWVIAQTPDQRDTIEVSHVAPAVPRETSPGPDPGPDREAVLAESTGRSSQQQQQQQQQQQTKTTVRTTEGISPC